MLDGAEYAERHQPGKSRIEAAGPASDNGTNLLLPMVDHQLGRPVLGEELSQLNQDQEQESLPDGEHTKALGKYNLPQSILLNINPIKCLLFFDTCTGKPARDDS